MQSTKREKISKYKKWAKNNPLMVKWYFQSRNMQEKQDRSYRIESLFMRDRVITKKGTDPINFAWVEEAFKTYLECVKS